MSRDNKPALYKHFLKSKGFQSDTLNLLNIRNLRKLALDYGWRD